MVINLNINNWRKLKEYQNFNYDIQMYPLVHLRANLKLNNGYWHHFQKFIRKTAFPLFLAFWSNKNQILNIELITLILKVVLICQFWNVFQNGFTKTDKWKY